MLTPVQRFEIEFKEFNEIIKKHPNGRPITICINNTYKNFKVIGITWRGSVKNPIPCFITTTGGLIDFEHYTIL